MIDGGRRDKGFPFGVINHLRIDLFHASEDIHTRAFGRAKDTLADPLVTVKKTIVIETR
jgi:hypothetical protein